MGKAAYFFIIQGTDLSRYQSESEELKTMRTQSKAGGRVSKAGERTKPTRSEHAQMPRKRHKHWRTLGVVLLVLAVVLGVGRAIMPWAVRHYVNRTLDRSPLYSGNIGQVQIHLWRGAYSIHDVRISKTTGNVPVPLFAAKRLDFAIQWNALFHQGGRPIVDTT